MNDVENRHLDLAGFERCLALGVPVEFPVDGVPRSFVFVDTQRPAIGLRIPDDGSRPEITLEHVEVRPVYRDEAQWLEVLITDPDLFLDGYTLLCAIADRIQLRGMDADSAIAETLRILGRLLARIDGLSVEKELGLLGELLTLRGLVTAVGVDDAVGGWCGPESEEHDFTLRGVDVEVKTTHSERRAHWISSLTQLEPSPDRPLWLVSLQLTKASSDAGTTLSACIAALRRDIGRGNARDRFDSHLEKAGWRESQTRTLRTRWRHRFASHAYLVDDTFPRLTTKALVDSGVLMSHIPDVRYRVDLSDIHPATDPPSLLGRALITEA